jgi:8-oxo-dGTP diphosphatase
MQQTTLCFLVRGHEVLLAMKKRGFGVGKWNGVGGKVKEGESVEAAAVREIYEEIGVSVSSKSLASAGTLHFRFKDNPDWEQICSVFIVHGWEGEPSESDEMRPQWYADGHIPFEKMWIDDPHWLPLVLAGKKVTGDFLFDNRGELLLKYSVI